MPDIVIHCKFDVVLQKCRKRLYIRPKVVGPFPVPCVSGSHVHPGLVSCL
jgi:hypothetical protein